MPSSLGILRPMARPLRFARPFLVAVLVTVAFLVGAARSTAYTPPIVCDTSGVITPATMDYGQTFAANVTYPCTLGDPTYTLACNGNNGTLYFWGMSEVTCQAKDSNGNLLPPAVMFPVSVTLPPPTFQTTPGNLSFPASGPAGGPATWVTPAAADVGGASVPVTCDHQSGLTYPIGDTLVACTAQIQRNDSQGHAISGLPSATTQFTITISAASSGGGGGGGGGEPAAAEPAVAPAEPTVQLLTRRRRRSSRMRTWLSRRQAHEARSSGLSRRQPILTTPPPRLRSPACRRAVRRSRSQRIARRARRRSPARLTTQRATRPRRSPSR